MKRWYVIYTKPKSEYKVAAWLSQQEIEIYLPELGISHFSSAKSGSREILFPCYLFVKFSLEEECLSSLQWVPGVRNIVSFGGNPATIPDNVVNEIRQNIELLSETEDRHSKSAIKSGTPVRITNGLFQNMQAIFERPISSNERVQILLDILGSLNRVNIDINDLEIISDKQVSCSNPVYKKRQRYTRGHGRHIKVKK